MKTLILHFFNGKLSPSTIIEVILRCYLGYFMIINSVVGITIPLEDLGLPQAGYLFIKSLWETGYLMHLTKLIEFICGLALVLNIFVPLALVLLMPVLVNILGIGYFVLHSIHYSLPLFLSGIVLLVLHYKSYRPLLKLHSYS